MPATDLRARARDALAARRRELLPPGALAPGGTHVLALEDALVPTLDAGDVAWVHDALAARAKGELRPTRAGLVPLHAAWSSAALVAGAYAPWRGDAPIRLEERLLIPHGGGAPNLDLALEQDDGTLVGVEAKLTEHLAASRPRPWKGAYRRPAMAGELDPGWRATFAGLLADEERAPRHLDAGQLVRHALSLRGRGELVYLHWEPANAEEHPEVLAHRAEVEALLERVGDARPALRALTWSALLAGWRDERPAHVAALRDRYDVPLAT